MSSLDLISKRVSEAEITEIANDSNLKSLLLSDRSADFQGLEALFALPLERLMFQVIRRGVISHPSHREITPLLQCLSPKLKSLSIIGATLKLIDTESLAPITSLTSLSGDFEPEALQSITKLQSLTRLDVWSGTKKHNLEILSHCSSITELTLEGETDIQGVLDCANNTNLRTLEVLPIQGTENQAALALINSTTIETLDLHVHPLTVVVPFSANTTLCNLFLSSPFAEGYRYENFKELAANNSILHLHIGFCEGVHLLESNTTLIELGNVTVKDGFKETYSHLLSRAIGPNYHRVQDRLEHTALIISLLFASRLYHLNRS